MNNSGRLSRSDAFAAVHELGKHARHHDDFDAEFSKLAKRHTKHDHHHVDFNGQIMFSYD